MLVAAQSLLVVNLAYLGSMGLYTVPLYSLLVHMGGDYKAKLREAVPLPVRPIDNICVSAALQPSHPYCK